MDSNIAQLHPAAGAVDHRALLMTQLDRQRQRFLQEGPPSAAQRRERIDCVIAMMMDNMDALCQTMSEDFGHRSPHQSRMADFYGTLESLKSGKRQLERWMRPEKRKVPFPLGLFGARGRIEYQPKGVVGNISTWNFPVFVSFSTLAGVFAAGNRCMLKLSEFVPATSALMQQLIARYFDDTVLSAVTGGPEIGAVFASLPFDHILFTGATGIGRQVMRACAENLTPVTLELGGKSPVIIGSKTDLRESALRIMAGKGLNVGQVCLSPDYVFVPADRREEFVAHCVSECAALYPRMLDNPDYTSVLNARHYQRIRGYVDDAGSKGAEVRVINPANENFDNQTRTHKLPITLVINPGEDTRVMQDEIFGPVLCIKEYRDLDEVIRYINQHPRPLALYYFGEDAAEQRRILDHTHSGGVTINDVMGHVSADDLPFGGIGASGMGAYHGIEGFKTFSHAKSVYRQTRMNMMKLGGMLPPYGPKTDAGLKRMLKR